ncbi:MAG: Rrf2 family transcriptional regulator [Clostridia bacterium]|nr:Rrf2 family transcriptional regulator [Clostridia bacterium]
MRITQESDYALRIVTALAAREGVADAKSLSEETSVSLRFALKILHKLVTGGIVRSFKGVNGGYSLALPASEITMKDVIELIDGPISICRCLTEDEVCTQSADKRECLFHRIFSGVSASVAVKLGRIRISDIVSPDQAFFTLLRELGV